MPTVEYAPTNSPDQLLSLYPEHAGTARALASSLLFDRSDAEDVVQDVFLTLYCRPDCYYPERGTGRALLLTAVRNRSLDQLRRRAIRYREDVSDLAERLPDPESSDIADDVIAAARGALLWRLVDGLPACQAGPHPPRLHQRPDTPGDRGGDWPATWNSQEPNPSRPGKAAGGDGSGYPRRS